MIKLFSRVHFNNVIPMNFNSTSPQGYVGFSKNLRKNAKQKSEKKKMKENKPRVNSNISILIATSNLLFILPHLYKY